MSTRSHTPESPLAPELQELIEQARTQKTEVVDLVGELGEAQFAWRPAPKRWSIGEHLAHLPKATRPYLEAIHAALDGARSAGLLGPGPYRHGRLGNWFVRTMEPPPRIRIRTMKYLEPAGTEPKAAVLEEFLAVQDEVISALESANGVDLGRATMRSPFLRWIKLDVGQAFGVVMAHNRRHFWQIRRIESDPRLPRRADG